ncbi:amino acid ABC transporter permease [Streptomyces sp. NPDC001393]
MRIRPISRAGTRVTALVAGLICLLALWSLAHNPAFEWTIVRQYMFKTVTLRGLGVTLYLTIVSLVIGIVGGVVLAVMRLSRNPVLSGIAIGYIGLFRSVPLLVQIIFWGYLGALYKHIGLGIPFTNITFFSYPTNELISPTMAALLALGLNEIAYAAEIVRGGILAIDHGQSEAAYSLGMPPALTMRRVVLPQAMRTVVPALGNEVISMVKGTALVSVIAGADLLTNLQNIYSQTYQVIPLLTVASIWYGVLTALLSIPQRYLEKRFGRGHETGLGR